MQLLVHLDFVVLRHAVFMLSWLRSSLVADKVFCSSRLPLPAVLTAIVQLLQAERILHDLLDFLLDDLLVLHDFLVEVYLCDSAPIAPPGHLHRSLDAMGLADCNFLLYCNLLVP